MMNLLVIAVDRLHVGYLGCYGSTWVATPAIDRLAAGGFVFDQAIVDTLDPSVAYDSWWRGTHAAERTGDRPGATFAEVAARAGLKPLLAADDPAVLGHAAGAAFDDAWELPQFAPEAATAADIHSTHAAQAFAAASQRLGELAEPFALWLHVGTLGGAWDAPASFRERYRDEEDPPIPTFTALPSRTLPADVDLDERFAFALAYAGQVSLVDACLGGLLEHLEEAGRDRNTAVLLCGLRGLALGEHHRVGLDDERLYAENVHVPWIVRLPDGRGRLRRSQALVQPCDLTPTAAELLGATDVAVSSGFGRSLLPPVVGEATRVRDRAPIVGRDELGLRTPRWSLRCPRVAAGDDELRAELFVKPDDFWEVNDVADRVPVAVEELRACCDATVAALGEARTPPELPPAENMLES
jgi:arylsulfatase A-like enzyme